MTDVRKILVVGGGIGGLCTTIALRRAGLEVDLVEKNPAWDVYGVGIIQPGNALRALNELGLAKEAVEQGHPIVGDRTWLADGQTELATNTGPPSSKGRPRATASRGPPRPASSRTPRTTRGRILGRASPPPRSAYTAMPGGSRAPTGT